MTTGRLVWRIAIRPLTMFACMTVLLILRFVVGLDIVVAILVWVALTLALLLGLVRYYRGAGKALRRKLMREALVEPIWARVLSEMLSLPVLVVGVASVTRGDKPINLWVLATTLAETILLAAPVLIAVYAALAYWERRNTAAELAREDDV